MLKTPVETKIQQHDHISAKMTQNEATEDSLFSLTLRN